MESSQRHFCLLILVFDSVMWQLVDRCWNCLPAHSRMGHLEFECARVTHCCPLVMCAL